MIGLAPTTMNWFETDYAIITSYDNATGLVVLDRQLTYYHWGQAQSTGVDYSGLDMRGEVVLLSRNIKIVGNETEDWGAQILTSDFVEGDGTQRSGLTMMDNVEVYNCSQFDTFKAAIRFEASYLSKSVISNCAIHHGLGKGVQLLDAANLTFINNTIFMFVGIGINMESVSNMTI